MNNEFEYIQHSNIGNLKIFLVSLVYRSPHIHSDLEICYVQDGEISITSQRHMSMSQMKNAPLNIKRAGASRELLLL